MITRIVTSILISISLDLSAQDEKVHQEKMKVFKEWVGQWQGNGWMQMGPGEPKNFVVDEVIQPKLDETILLIEGIGKTKDAQTSTESTVHHALAILSYDPVGSQYKFRAHLKNGRSTEAWFNVLAENKFQWGFDSPQGKIRYSITIDPITKMWNESGEFSSDGNSWRKFIEMNLKKI
jgi:hypothetical protein